MKDFYTENYKASLRATKDLYRWKDICVHGLGDLLLLKWQYCQKLSTHSLHSLSKLKLPFWGQKRQADPKIQMQMEGPEKSKRFWKKDSEVGKNHTSNFTTLAQTCQVIKTVVLV